MQQMKKYVRGAICLGYSLARFWLLKIFHLRGFQFTNVNVISPFAEIDLGAKARLSLGRMVKIRGGSRIRVRGSAEVSIGANTYLNHGCMIVSHEKITIGEGVQFGPNVMVYDHDHDRSGRRADGSGKLKFKTSPVVIGDNVWVGANTVILRGTVIGDNCVIGAGSVIKGHYADNQVIVQKRETEVTEVPLRPRLELCEVEARPVEPRPRYEHLAKAVD
ncbi:MAG TPA: acyltransferase [Ideonella sp.]|uniref:acyltransferase n=1 Tax=Ideonella sp. TaxID=1929293 RepID=UPI002D11D068|nr:acyltransferase [Ideonella sp.]HSI47005.1 acyltransferase [Ideonella sp.]